MALGFQAIVYVFFFFFVLKKKKTCEISLRVIPAGGRSRRYISYRSP